MSDPLQAARSTQARPAWWRRFGRRNLAYIAFVALLVPLGMVLEATGPAGPDRGGGVWTALLLWVIGSIAFFVVNAMLMMIALAKGRPAGKPAIACALPVAVIVGTMILEGVTTAVMRL
jgi:hypothetical protein